MLPHDQYERALSNLGMMYRTWSLVESASSFYHFDLIVRGPHLRREYHHNIFTQSPQNDIINQDIIMSLANSTSAPLELPPIQFYFHGMQS